MVQYLKKSNPRSRQDDRALIDRVRDILADIEQNGDAAVRRYARELDRWEKPDFRVSTAESAAAAKSLGSVFKEDFDFCKKQVTDFAKRQRVSVPKTPSTGLTRQQGQRSWRRSSDLSDLGFQLVDQDALVFRIVNRRDNQVNPTRFECCIEDAY